MNYTIYNVTNKEELDNLYKNSALTIEGLAEDSICDFVEWITENTDVLTDDLVVYVTKGKIMNDNYYLTGNNRYQDDLSLVSVVDINLMKVTFKRFEIGGRWFDDIVDNNASRQCTYNKRYILWEE